MAGTIAKGGARLAGGTGKFMQGLKKTAEVTGQVSQVAGDVGQIKQSVGGVMPSMPKFGGGGGGGPSVFGGGSNKPKKSTTTLIILIFAMVIFAIIAFWYISSGGLQQSAGSSYVSEQQTQKLMENVWIRKIQNFFTNGPFGISTTAGEYEQVSEVSQASASAPNQVFSLSLQVTPGIVTYNSEALIAMVTIQNEGSTTIKEMVVSLESQQPSGNCVRFNNIALTTSNICKEDKEPGKYFCTVQDIPPFASKQLIITGGKIDRTCVQDAFDKQNIVLDPTAPIDVFINVKGSTYYPSSSRLAVERIRTDYGILLIQNSLLMQQSRGAVYQTGTAVTVDMDSGEQPILDQVNETGLLMSWVNVGSGKIDPKQSPILFIVTPHQFGPCVLQGMGGIVVTDTSEGKVYGDTFTRCNETTNKTLEAQCTTESKTAEDAAQCVVKGKTDNCNALAASISGRKSEFGFFDAMCDQADVLSGNSLIKCMICDQSLIETWCDKTNSSVYRQIATSAGTVKESFDWACGLIGQKDENGNLKYDVCATNGMGQEFGVMTCKLNTNEIIGANRITRYVTAIALYPYVVEAPYATVKAYEALG